MDKKHKILIVDDNNDNLSVLGNILMQNSYSLQLANNGELALQVALKKHPDLILLDINMPGMSGYEVCTKLKSDPLTAEIPVIFLTAHTANENIVQAFSVGGVDYITKPFQEEELILRVKTHLELRDAKESLKQKNKQLEKLNSTKDKLFSIISHDLRGPIGLIMKIIEIILEKPDLNEERMRTYFKSQKELTQNTYFLLVNLLNWARQNMNQIKFLPKELELADLINECLYETKFNAEQKNISIKLNCKQSHKVFADEDMVTLILRNLMANAIKFTPNEGTIKVDVENDPENVWVQITDSGAGISNENMERILSDSEFFSTRGTNNEKGTGLGLKLVKDFVAQNNGELTIKSEKNKGSCFTFSLPSNL